LSRYEILVFLHIAAAIIWLGAGFVFAVLAFDAERHDDRARLAAYHHDAGALAPILFIPASLATFILGLLLVADGPWTMGALWIDIGLAGWLASFLLGILYFKPEGERITSIVAERGVDDPEVARRVRRLNLVDRVQVTIVFLVVLDMVGKPTGDDGGLLAVMLLLFAAAAVPAIVALRRPSVSV
jgi:uncharacterized membrane protein